MIALHHGTIARNPRPILGRQHVDPPLPLLVRVLAKLERKGEAQ